jgi:hypothetical protein
MSFKVRHKGIEYLLAVALKYKEGFSFGNLAE